MGGEGRAQPTDKPMQVTVVATVRLKLAKGSERCEQLVEARVEEVGQGACRMCNQPRLL